MQNSSTTMINQSSHLQKEAPWDPIIYCYKVLYQYASQMNKTLYEPPHDDKTN